MENLFFESLRREEDIIAVREMYSDVKEVDLCFNYKDLTMNLEVSYFNPKSFGQEFLIEPYNLSYEEK